MGGGGSRMCLLVCVLHVYAACVRVHYTCILVREGGGEDCKVRSICMYRQAEDVNRSN